MTRPFPIVVAMLLASTSAPLVAAAPQTATRAPATKVSAPTAAPAVTVPYDRFVLPNGLTAIVYSDKTVPSVFVGVWYRTGSKDEPPGKSGFAHLFEHLMFQQTTHRQADYMAAMARTGASGMNGSTTADYTNYYQVVPTNALDTALWLESDRMGYLDGGITQTAFEEQRAVVLNEKRQRETPTAEAAQAQFNAGYYPAGHPYAHSTIGSAADLNAATLTDVKTWFRDHYGATNAVVILAGDIDPATAREKVTRYFGGLPAGKPIAGPVEWVPGRAGSRRDVMYVADGAGRLARSWPVSNDDPRRNTMLLLASRTMTAVRDSPFVRELVDEEKVATGVEADFETNVLDSRFSISMRLRPGVTIDQAGAALDRAVARFIAAGPPADALRQIRQGTDAAILRSLDNSTAVAQFLIDGEVVQGDPGFFLKQRDWALAATPAAVGDALRDWLTRPYYDQALLPAPGGDAGAKTTDVDRATMPVPGPLKTAIALPPITEMRLANGLKLVVAERHKIPLVDATMVFDTGSDVDAAYAPGAATAAFATMPMGTTTMSGQAIAETVSRLGVPIVPGSGDTSSKVVWNSGTQNLDAAFAFAADVIRHPAYPAAAIDGAAKGTAKRLAGALDPVSRADVLLANAIWGDADPRGRLAKPGDYDRLNRDTVVRFHDREIGPSNATLVMVGDVTPARAKALAERYFGDWKPNAPTPVMAASATQPQPPRIILIDTPGAGQSSITVGAPIAPFDRDRDAAEQVANAVLADGTNGRLNLDLRETRGWTYGIGGNLEGDARGARLFVAGGSFQTDKTADAMAEIRRQVAAIVTDRPITAEELADMRDSAARGIPAQLEGSAALMSAIATAASYGLPYQRIATGAERLSSVTLDQVRAAAARMYSPDRLTWVVVGDLKAIEQPVRALNIAPVEVWDASGKRLR